MKVVPYDDIVIVTGHAGTGGEYRAPVHGEQTYDILVSGATGGAPIMAAWWAPYDNIKDITSIRELRVDVAEPDHINLVIGAYNEDNHITRIRVYLMTQ